MHFLKFLDSYLDNLSKVPERADLIFLWTISVFFIWFWMVKFRERSIRGSEGEGQNPSWETREQIIFWCLWMTPPMYFYFLYFTEYKLYAFGLVAGILGYQIFGRFIFDWVLAFKGGLSEVPEHKVVKTEVEAKLKTTETTTTEK